MLPPAGTDANDRAQVPPELGGRAGSAARGFAELRPRGFAGRERRGW